VVAADTAAVGEHHGTITIDSDGGSATIRVRASVDPTPLAAPEVATTPPEKAPAASEHARSGSQHEAGLAGVSLTPTIPAGEARKPTPARAVAELTDKSSADRALIWPALPAILGILLLFLSFVMENPSGMLGTLPFIVVLAAAVGLLSSSRWQRVWAGLMVGSASWAALGAGNYGTILDSINLEAADILRFTSFLCLLLSSAGVVLLLLLHLSVTYRFTPLHGLLAFVAAVAGTGGAAFFAYSSPSTSYGTILLSIASAAILLGSGICHPHYIGVATMAGWSIQALVVVLQSSIPTAPTIWVPAYQWHPSAMYSFVLLGSTAVVAGSAITLMRAAQDERLGSGLRGVDSINRQAGA
jgi:hypothetical protein